MKIESIHELMNIEIVAFVNSIPLKSVTEMSNLIGGVGKL